MYKFVKYTFLALLASILLTLAVPFPATAKVEREYKYVNRITGKASFRQKSNGIVVITSDSARAVEPFGNSVANMKRYAEIANRYARELGKSVNVYCMPIPTSNAFYWPDAAKGSAKMRPGLLAMFDALSPAVKAVDVYPELGRHAAEPIYSRTDHHWAPRGAFYAAKKLCEEAGVKSLPLSAYNAKVLPGYVGTMFGYTKDQALKAAPEKFVYYVPKNVKITTTYTDYKLDASKKRITGVNLPKQGEYFVKTALPSAYCTFGGSDARIIKIKTSAGTGRKLMIIKDSFGNALAPFLMGSFDEIHVVDYRYFKPNLKKYVADNGITDLVLANNVMVAGGSANYTALNRFLTQ